MFKKSFVYHFKSTASSLPSNIFTVSDSNFLTCGIVHNNAVCLFNGSDLSNLSFRHILCDEDTNAPSYNIIISIGIIQINKKPLLAILKENTFYLYESNGSAMIYSVESKNIEPNNTFCCYSSIGESYIFIGTDSGLFLKFEVSKDEIVQYKGCMRAHNIGLICMNADKKWLGSADENSTIQFWKITTDSTLDLISKYTPMNNEILSQPSTILMLQDKRVCAAGFTNGRLCLFNCETGRLLAEISAHSKIITSLTFQIDILISVSEDSICRIWRVTAGNDSSGDDKPSASVTLIQSMIVADQMLQGVAFTNRKGLEFVISAYDSNEVTSFIQS